MGPGESMTEPKIFGVGLSKTGTTSLYAALTILGYRAGTFRDMRKIKLTEWVKGDFSHDYLMDFDAVTDLPISFYFRELDARYPGSKFILTVRDVESWLVSIERQFTAKPDPKRFSRDTRMIAYGFSVFNREAFARRFGDHNREVREHFHDRPDQLLVVDFFQGDGWEEICEFLGKPIPGEPFPNVKPGFRVEPTET